MTIPCEGDLLRHHDQPTELSARSLGWLRYLDRKAHTPDNWNRDGRPHAHWDNRSDPPMASWHRFDLVESSYAIGLMAHTTPAWRERYIAILDQLIERHTSWWSAADWLTQFGEVADYLRVAPSTIRRLTTVPALPSIVADVAEWRRGCFFGRRLAEATLRCAEQRIACDFFDAGVVDDDPSLLARSQG